MSLQKYCIYVRGEYFEWARFALRLALSIMPTAFLVNVNQCEECVGHCYMAI
jgi:hypothetical protein